MGLTERSTSDLLILLVASTICFTVCAAGVGIFVLALAYPERDLAGVVSALAYILNTLLGLLAGYFIGVGRRHKIEKE